MTCGEHLKDGASTVTEESSQHMCGVTEQRRRKVLAGIQILQNSIATSAPPPPPPPPPPLPSSCQRTVRCEKTSDQRIKKQTTIARKRHEGVMRELSELLK